MEINDLIKQAHETAKSKGWWEKEATFGETIALIHSELSEVLEEHRNGKMLHETYLECKDVACSGNKKGNCTSIMPCPEAKPCGIPSELADVLIRIFDFCGKHNIDLEKALQIKMGFNKTRSYRHGGKKV
jgi:NTP pyrophosphatase (non-canonical NTP hydrolase)